MTIARRNILGLIAASAATALAGCGGGDGPNSDPVWVLNLNPDFPSAEVTIRDVVVAQNLPFKGLTNPIEVGFGTYTIGFRDPTGVVRPVSFPSVSVNQDSAIEVFYRDFNTVGLQPLLESSPPVVINLFDVDEYLRVELYDEFGNVQVIEKLAFKEAVQQLPKTNLFRLRVIRFNDLSLVYDSGPSLRARPRVLLLFPLFPGVPFEPILGRVGVVELEYSGANATAKEWPTS